MRRHFVSSLGCAPSAPRSCCVPGGLSFGASRRPITSRGQFNPIHNFSYAMERGVRARDAKSFEKLLSNPGPLRLDYTPDYLDWLYRCYRAKCTFTDARAVAEKKFNGNILSGGYSGASRTALAAQTGEDGAGDTRGRLPGAPPPGMFLRPSHSFRRITGEMKRKHAQDILDEVAKAQGMLDLFERQPHFPAIHIDRCSRFHLVELFKEMVLERALDSAIIWEKALMYRAILSERKLSYPPSFQYIFGAVEDTVFAPAVPHPAADSTSGAMGAAAGVAPHPLSVKCPTAEAYYYFLYLVKRYYVDNAVEAHVVLRCHQAPNVGELLFSNPPPKDETEVLRAIEVIRAADLRRKAEAESGASPSSSSPSPAAGSESGAGKAPGETKPKPPRRPLAPREYPPIDMLWRCEENVPLLKVLLFGEFNLLVSENPFVKFPNAHAYITRPYSSESTQVFAEGVSLASVMAERRGHLLPSIPRNTAGLIDMRAQELRRLQHKHHREDIVSFQTLLRGTHAEDNPFTYSSYADWSYFNPRAVRAEERDRLTLKGLRALKLYDSATQDIYCSGYDSVMLCHTQRVSEGTSTMPSYLPTLPHFVAIVKKDPHISFLSHVGLDDRGSSTEAAAKHRELERRIYYLSRALYHMALEYHKEAVRRVNRQKVNVAAALLDSFVEEEWAAMLRAAAVQGAPEDGKVQMARRLGQYLPFARRPLEDSGFPTDARADDYARWMQAPTVMSGRTQ
uniref:Mitochondrial SSU ribosomal protein n=1 Tax=Trypanosoma vivax (strain Y486) TaxID=1055687 RepID=G0UAE1_TRYVY|nr:conserved hypothetical protein [Trypanosoma vivax Y486]